MNSSCTEDWLENMYTVLDEVQKIDQERHWSVDNLNKLGALIRSHGAGHALDVLVPPNRETTGTD